MSADRDGADPSVSASIGLYPRASFRIVRGEDAGDATIRQARWYFARETLAVPMPGLPMSGFTPGLRAQDDVKRWARDRAEHDPLAYPPLVWIGAPDTIRDARIDAEGRHVATRAGRKALALAPKHPLNRSYFDASSARFLARRSVKLRGTIEGDRFVARTFWPEDFALPEAPAPRPLTASTDVALALRAFVREAPSGGAREPFAAFTLWQRQPGAPIRDGVALAAILNGAQGDDDEAHGGHFAIATGYVMPGGAIGDWLVNNFYTLDSESEKGILGAPVPLDDYLADLNAGQAWYRPSAMLVAVLRNPRAAALVQGAMNRVYNQFYRHQLHYDHAAMNCTGISVDTLRTLGLGLRARKPAWRAAAPLALPWLLATQRSLARARLAYDYATEDATRLLPAAAFEEAGVALMRAAARAVSDGPLASMLAEDLEALLFVRVPQLPSSRAWGDFPVVTTREYHARLPRRREDMKIIPVPPRPFPSDLRDDDVQRGPWRRSSVAIALWAALLAAATLVAVLAR